MDGRRKPSCRQARNWWTRLRRQRPKEKRSATTSSSFAQASSKPSPRSRAETTPATCYINSYINNLHPIKYHGLYDKIGKLFVTALPLIETLLSEVNDSGKVRKQLSRFPAKSRPFFQGMGYMDRAEYEQCETEYEEAMKTYNKTASVPAFAPPMYSR